MSTSMLFAESLTDEGCYCLHFSKDGTVDAPLRFRTDAEIKTMQMNSHTVVVLSSDLCGFYTVELPWIAERKARTALPFALEEQLAQKLSQLHVAFDKAYHQNNHYLVVVIEKSLLSERMARFLERGIEFNEISVDWLALNSGERCIIPSAVLIHDTQYQGALSGQLATRYLTELAHPETVLTFTDSSTVWQSDVYLSQDMPYFLWAAMRLHQKPRINLCQGEFTHQPHQQRLNRSWVYTSAVLACVSLVTFLGVKVVDILRLNHQLAGLDQQIAVLYRDFFPAAQHVISPRFRIGQLLKSGHGEQASSSLWTLLDRLETTFDGSQLSIEQVNYRNAVLTVTLKGNDFAVLESLQRRLKQQGLKVSQTQAFSQAGKVNAILELTL